MRTKFFAFAILMLAFALSACGPTTINQAAPENLRTLNVSGVGVVYLTPDIAYINIGVNTQGPNASEAVETNKAQTNAVIKAIQDFGVEVKDIRTTNFSIWPSPQYDELGQIKSTNYVVDNTVNVTIRDLDKLGDLLDAAISAGANSIYSIQFDVEDKTQAAAEARDQAVKDAKAEAEALANAAGLKLGDIQTISYFESSPTPYIDGRGGGFEAAASVPVPIQPGQLAISVTVNITYTIK